MTDLMPTMVQIKLKNGDLAWLPARKALLLALSKEADIVKDPPFKWDDDMEKFDWAIIFAKVYELMQSVPVQRFALNKERLDDTEEKLLREGVAPILRRRVVWVPKDILLEDLRKEYPHFEDIADPERRLRSIVQKGHLLKDNRPDTVYYHLP
jgi:hypothetical protein